MGKEHGRGSDSALRLRLQELRNRFASLLGKVDTLNSTASTLATEATLNTLLTAIKANNEDGEILIVKDVTNDVIVVQVREYDKETDTWTVRYENVGGGDYSPAITPATYEYQDATAVLTLLLTEIQNINSNIDTNLSSRASEATLSALATLLNTSQGTLITNTNNLDVALSTRASENTQLANNGLLTTIDSATANLDVALSTRASEVTLAALSAKLNSLGQKASAASAPVVLSTEQESILSGILTAVGGTQIGNFGIDAGGRTRVSQITTLLDGKVLNEDSSFLFQNVGTGSAVFANNKTNLSVALPGEYIIRQAKRFTPYFSGKVQLIEGTCDNFQTEAGVLKRLGYFSSNAVAPYNSNLDGFWLEDDGTKKVLKIYNDGVEKVSVDFTAMDNYALVSGYDFSNFTVIAFDFLWLGGAILRFWLKTELGFVLVHTVNYSGTDTDTFTKSPNQPLRYEVRSTGGAGSLRYICSQVATEGSLDEAGNTQAIYNDSNIAANSTSTTYALLGVKKLAAFRDNAVQIIECGATNAATNETGMLLLLRNPTLSAPLTYAPNGKVDAAIATTQTVSADGYVIAAIPSGISGQSSAMKENFLSFLTQAIDNTMDEYVLAYRPATTNQSVRGFINFKTF